MIVAVPQTLSDKPAATLALAPGDAAMLVEALDMLQAVTDPDDAPEHNRIDALRVRVEAAHLATHAGPPKRRRGT